MYVFKKARKVSLLNGNGLYNEQKTVLNAKANR